MSTTTMHFGPEWMRTKPQSASRTHPPPSPPPPPTSASASTYSSLLTSTPPQPPQSKDEAHPFRYSKEEMLRIYREGGGKAGLGLEVERWEGVVRETTADPVGLKEMGEAEKKLFSTSLNSDLRRRQSTDFLHLNTQNTERPRLNHANSSSAAAASPLRERFGSLMSRRRDSTDQPPLLPRKLSLTGQAPLMSPRESGMPSPRGRVGHTPGFDGVLNGGESWVARRRASEGVISKAALNSARDPGEDPKELEIREEDEENNLDSKSKPDRQLDSKVIQSSFSSEMALQGGQPVTDLPVQGASSITDSPASTSALIGPPPGMDLNNVEWSYLDPQGQVQGPFRADIMQKWSDDGYFTDELLMKRTHIDNDWISVGELKRRVGNNKVFLTPIPLQIPPGLMRRTDSPFSYANPNDPVYHNGPFQPSPVRQLRSSTLDSNYSDSPSSSFGASGRFSNDSPDPAFGGRAAQFAVGSGDMSGRFGGYPLNPGEASPALSGRSAFGLSSNDYRSAGFGNVAPGRGNSLDNGGFNSPATSWPTSSFDMNSGRPTEPLAYQGGFATAGTSTPLTVNGFQTSFAHSSLGVGGMGYEQYPPSPATQFTPSVHQQNAPQTIPDIFESQQPQTPARILQPVVDTGVPISAPPWGAVDSPVNNLASAANASVANNQSPWGAGRISRSSSQANEISPWLAASQGITDNWKEEQPVHSPSQPDPEEKQLAVTAVDVIAEIIPEPIPAPPTPEVPHAVVEPVIAPSIAAAPSKSRGKSTPHQTQPQTAKTIVDEPASVSPEMSEPQALSAAPATPKAPWAKEDDSKKSTTSLRKIQDAEAKKAEARKAAEREKERAARAAQPVSTPGEEVQPFTASWGLPTSKAGKGTSVAITPKETSSPVSPAVAPPVWSSTAPKPTGNKKTMKEIQEEEEKRKKIAAKETNASVATRRGYAESTSKPTPVPASSSNAWTTVGPSGKQTPTSVPVRPPITPSASAVSSASVARVNGVAARPTPTPVTKASGNNTKVDDFPIAPSAEFLKWLADSLKGLNSSVNVEDIMSMLLSFPVDPDPSTSEIISDLIYANSTTLDGRRFAADFLSKRKADAVARAKAGPAAAASKPVSIADVVKAQPKPQAQSEWGGFKVVNKKKKGGRA